MTNRDMIANYNGLDYIQSLENAHYKRTGEKLFKGRVKITYAIKKNMRGFLEKLKPYNDARDEVFTEYRDQDAEEKAAENLKKKMVTSPEGTAEYEQEMKDYNKKAGNLSIIMKPGKKQAEYEAKIQELLDIDVADVNIHTIALEQLDGIELDSNQLGLLLFMIEE
ncbi:hypothetical protein DXA57_02825 [Blautia sp. OF03-15BH]|uniref:hypothetical protein n=1 Tax=Blautia sp. OF03-15BH TaxID=2292287 RepID=UPI000E5462BE|nr:hypothetical protein [Blautia sp. OF03-15BH]RGY02229.1 hypothetical protein DXA57_02825 [Blautia sp. OF03-15BH]